MATLYKDMPDAIWPRYHLSVQITLSPLTLLAPRAPIKPGPQRHVRSGALRAHTHSARPRRGGDIQSKATPPTSVCSGGGRGGGLGVIALVPTQSRQPCAALNVLHDGARAGVTAAETCQIITKGREGKGRGGG